MSPTKDGNESQVSYFGCYKSLNFEGPQEAFIAEVDAKLKTKSIIGKLSIISKRENVIFEPSLDILATIVG